MGFNYAREKLLFDATWKSLAVEYEAEGFNVADIQKMRSFDWELFKQRRVYENHVQPLPDEDSCKSLMKKFLSFMNDLDETDFTGRFDWIQTISDPALFHKLDRLSDSDKELLTLLVIDGYSQAEIAAIYGCVHSVVSRKLSRIKKVLR